MIDYIIPTRFAVPIVKPVKSMILIAESPLDAMRSEERGFKTVAFQQPYTFTQADLKAMKRERLERRRPGDRKLHAPERRRPKHIAKKLRKRYGAQHYRDVYRCYEMQVKQAARPGKLERELLALQRRAHDDQLDALMLFGDSLHR